MTTQANRLRQNRIYAADYDPWGSEGLGSGAAIAGDWAVLGAAYGSYDSAGSYYYPGSAHIFKYGSRGWYEYQTLMPMNLIADGDGFGYDVAISGTTIAIGAPYSTNGDVYIYDLNATTEEWEYTTTITAHDGGSGDCFGEAVDIDGDTLVVGAPSDDNFGSNSGSAYVCYRASSVWSSTTRLDWPSASSGHYYGTSVAVDESANTIAVGAPDDGATQGFVVIHVGSQTTWAYQDDVTPNYIGSGPGSSVGEYGTLDVLNDTIAVGDTDADYSGQSNVGVVHVLKRTGSVWAVDHVLYMPAAMVTGATFSMGSAVRMGGEYIIAGARGFEEPVNPGGWVGGAFIFKDDGAGTYEYAAVAYPNETGEFGGAEATAFDPTTGRFLMPGDSSEIGIWNADNSWESTSALCGAAVPYQISELVEATGVVVINTIPEDGETTVPIEENVRLQIVSLDDVDFTSATVYITRSSDQQRLLAWSLAGGFHASWSGSDSSAIQRSSPGATALDEIDLVLDLVGDYESLEVVTVEVTGTTSLATGTLTYSFTIEDATAPQLTEILWLHPRKARLKWDEPVDTGTDPGGSRFVRLSDGNCAITSTSQISLYGVTPTAEWVGYWIGVSGSVYPNNNAIRPITAISTTGVITVDTSDAYGGPLTVDDGVDTSDAGVIVQKRKLKVSISPYQFTQRMSAEGLDEVALSAERVQVAYPPFVVDAELVPQDDLPVGEDTRQYVYVYVDDDVSYGRLFTIRADKVEDLNETPAVNTTLDFESPWFGYDQDRLNFWSDGVQSGYDKKQDLEYDKRMRKTAMVLQDVLQVLWHRTDQLKYLHDPWKCPDEWIDHLLYNRGNPFAFPLETIKLKRRLAAALPGFYKKVGTVTGIVDMLYLLLGIRFTINAYANTDYWTIGDPDLGKLGYTTILGPGTAYARNCYEVVSPVNLTADQRRIVTDVATWADPCTRHLYRIVEPGKDPITGGWWVMNESALGLTTKLGG